jgi:hypothetical protein
MKDKRRPQKIKNGRKPQKKNGSRHQNQSIKINLIGCDTIVNSPYIVHSFSKLATSNLTLA